MQELGVWTTAEGTSPATLQLGTEIAESGAEEIPKWAPAALSGAATGAVTGATVGGPWGALIGAAAGAALGGAISATSEPQTPPAPPARTSPPRSSPPPRPPAVRGGSPPATAVRPAAPSVPPATASPFAPAAPPVAPAAPPVAATGPGDSQSAAVLALQQFATAIPALVQLLGTTSTPSSAGTPTRPPEFADVEGRFETAAADDGLEFDEVIAASGFEGAWTIHE